MKIESLSECIILGNFKKQINHKRFLATYDKLPMNILRIDSVRYMYMHYYGGVYADLDFECVGNMEDLFRGKKVVLGRMGTDTNFAHSIPNAWYKLESLYLFEGWQVCLGIRFGYKY